MWWKAKVKRKPTGWLRLLSPSTGVLLFVLQVCADLLCYSGDLKIAPPLTNYNHLPLKVTVCVRARTVLATVPYATVIIERV